jgi:penicillin-binding protein 1A
MAYAFSTIANEGVRRSSSLAPDQTGPVGVLEVKGAGRDEKGEVVEKRVFSPEVGGLAKEMLRLVVTSGTGEAAQVGDEDIWGKTGTTENYGDAWFVGGNEDLTVAIWVGYADKVQPMEYEHAGGPVAGGTFPAEIFHDFLASWIEMRELRRAARAAERGGDEEDSADGTYTPPATTEAVPEEEAPTETVPEDQGGQPEAPEAAPTPEETPETPVPETPVPAEPAPAPTEPPSGGGGTAPAPAPG